MRLSITCVTLTLACALLLGCKNKDRAAGTSTGENGNVVGVAADDPEMNAALAKGRASLDNFTRALASPAGRKAFAINARFEEGGLVEYLWVGHVSFDGTMFHGTIQNDPEQVTSLKMGEAVHLERSKVVDWTYFDEQGRMHGNYSARVLIARDPSAGAGRPPFADD